MKWDIVGQPPQDPSPLSSSGTLPPPLPWGQRYKSVSRLPGPASKQTKTLHSICNSIHLGRPSDDASVKWLMKTLRTSNTYAASIKQFLASAALIEVDEQNRLTMTPLAEAWSVSQDDKFLISILHSRFQFIGEMMEALREPQKPSDLLTVANSYKLSWNGPQQISNRRGWLQSAGMIESVRGHLYKLTTSGLQLLEELDVYFPDAIIEASKEIEPSIEASTRMPSEVGQIPQVPRRSQGHESWDTAIPLFRKLFSASVALRGSQTVADAFKSDLGDLMSRLEMDQSFEDMDISELINGGTLGEEAYFGLKDFLESLDPIERIVFEERVLCLNPTSNFHSNQTTGKALRRLRHIEQRVRMLLNQRLDSTQTLGKQVAAAAALVGQQVGPVVTPIEIDNRISVIFPMADHIDSNIVQMNRLLVVRQLNYTDANGLCFSKEATTLVAELNAIASALADEIGLVDESELRRHLPDDSWSPFWEQLLDHSSLHRLNGYLALRDTIKARIMAAILDIGRPASKEEISTRSGVNASKLAPHLSLLPNVVRADKTRWGLAEWIEDEYEGIPAEIIQRIEEDGGATRLNRLLSELPRQFGVRESSIKAYLDTPAFQIEYGWVSVADEPDVPLGRLEDVVDGYDANGDPYWSFYVERRHLDGHRIRDIPGEVAVALGCNFGGASTVLVRSPENCKSVSLIWRKTSARGPRMGRLVNVLEAISATSGDHVSIVIHGASEVSFIKALRRFPSGRSEIQRSSALRAFEGPGNEAPRPFPGVRTGTPIVGLLDASVSNTKLPDSDPAK